MFVLVFGEIGRISRNLKVESAHRDSGRLVVGKMKVGEVIGEVREQE